MANDNQHEGVFSHRARVYSYACNGHLSEDVIDALLPNGDPIAYERQLWDYKLQLPTLPAGRKPTSTELDEYNGGMSELIKDAAAFFNTYGGYILAGVKDSPREIIGLHGNFDCDELNKRIAAATGKQIECFFKTFARRDLAGKPISIGLLFIPQRPDGEPPAQFSKDAAPKPSGKKPYSKSDIYFRSADQCVPATLAEHFAFLCTPGRRTLKTTPHAPPSPILDSNLGDRDPAFIEFVGRDDYLAALWRWFLDKYNPVKLLAGIGGVGKTALAREFAEQVSHAAPFGFQKIVWLSAKKQFYTATLGQYVPTSRVDFADVDGLLRQICFELGLVEDDLPVDPTREQLVETTIAALQVMPSLVVVDDIDTLDQHQQQDAFHTLITIFGQTVGKSPVGSRALLTARLDLGAAPGRVIHVKGLIYNDFSEFVDMTVAALDLKIKLLQDSKRMKRFHQVTEGSPTFASSVLRLVSLGESIDQALVKWEKSDGEEVRCFAFQKELDQLSDSAQNTLYVLCVLSHGTLVELSNILSRSEQQIRDDIGDLRQFHLIAHAEDHLPGGVRISVPSSIRMMREVLRAKIREPRRIETSCAKLRAAAAKVEQKIGPQIHRVVALWANEKPEDALDLAVMLDRDNPDNADIKCLLGRAYLRLPNPQFKRAEISLRKAQELGCKRQELLPLWVETKVALKDWAGLLEITRYGDKSVPGTEILLARFDAYKQLAEIERRANNLRSAAERYLEGGKEIDALFRQRKASGAVLELKQLRKEFLTSHILLIDKITAGPNDYLDIWLAAVQCFDCFVRGSGVVRLGADRLREWWIAVEHRDTTSERSAAVMSIQLGRLRNMINALGAQEQPDEPLLSQLVALESELGSRLFAYSNISNCEK